jgi:hypothetical protein
MENDQSNRTPSNGSAATSERSAEVDRTRHRVWRPTDDPYNTGYVHRVDDTSVVAGRPAAKFLLLEVPNFNREEDAADQMGSYLRLGTVPDPSIAGSPDAPPATGEDLAAYATSFLDDDRVRDGCPGFVPPEERKAETARLHTKGGWRDHSDGNRITTTRGDKVEVVRGNYQLIVLGRQDEASDATGWDVSGGHIEGIGGKSSIEWRQTFDGSWKTHEASERGDTHVIQHGNSTHHAYGELQDSTTGSEDEMRASWDKDGNSIWIPAPNPAITDRTWARSIASYSGSSKRRVPTIDSECWADAITSLTNVHSMSDVTHARDSMSSTTVAGSLSNVMIAGQMSNINLAANTTNLNLGVMENVNVGAMLDITIAAMLQICVNASLTINVGPRREYNLSTSEGLAMMKQDVAAVTTRVSAASESVVTAAYSVMAAVIHLG